MHFKLVPHDALASSGVKSGDLLPIQLGDEIRNRLTFHIGLKSKKPSNGLVEVKNAALLIDDQDAVFNCVEQRLQERALGRQPLNDVLQARRIQPADPAQNFVEKTGLSGHQKEVRNPKQAVFGLRADWFEQTRYCARRV